jgi:hypothetical protein
LLLYSSFIHIIIVSFKGYRSRMLPDIFIVLAIWVGNMY